MTPHQCALSLDIPRLVLLFTAAVQTLNMVQNKCFAQPQDLCHLSKPLIYFHAHTKAKEDMAVLMNSWEMCLREALSKHLWNGHNLFCPTIVSFQAPIKSASSSSTRYDQPLFLFQNKILSLWKLYPCNVSWELTTAPEPEHFLSWCFIGTSQNSIRVGFDRFLFSVLPKKAT